MNKGEIQETATIHRAEIILTNLGLNWDNLKDKKVLDLGSGSSALAHAAAILGIPTDIFSIDIDRQKEWDTLPSAAKNKVVQGDSQSLPYADESFDLVLDHAATGVFSMNEAVRTLRSGGQFRMYPIGGQTLEYWYISCYLSEIRGQDPASIQQLIQDYDQQIITSDGVVPNAYIALRQQALNALSPDQKVGVIDMMVSRYEELTGISPLSYQLKDPAALEPNGVIIFQK